MSKPPTRRELLAQVGAEAPEHAGATVRLAIAIAHQLGMSLADVQCMGLLAAGPSAPSSLAAQLGLTTGAMTKVLDRLEQAGCITRAADPSDRRRIIISADPGGLGRVGAAYAAIDEKMSRHLGQYTAAELQAVLAFLRAGRQAADEQISRIRRQGIRHAIRRRRGAGAVPPPDGSLPVGRQPVS